MLGDENLVGQIIKGGEINLKRLTNFNFEVTVKLVINWPSNINKPYVYLTRYLSESNN